MFRTLTSSIGLLRSPAPVATSHCLVNRMYPPTIPSIPVLLRKFSVSDKSRGKEFFSTNLNLKDNNHANYNPIHTSDLEEMSITTNRDSFPVSNNKSSSPPDESQYGEKPRVSILMELTDRIGVLHDVLKYFWKHDINVTRIESRPSKIMTNQSEFLLGDKVLKRNKKFDFFLDFHGSLDEEKIQSLMQDLKNASLMDRLLVLDEKDVHWFPRHISELDLIAHRTLDAGIDLESDHPGFNDKVYRSRRAKLARNANSHTWKNPIPNIDYTKEEIETWGAVWDQMEGLWKKYACKEYLNSINLLKQSCGYSRDNIPQQQDISEFLQRKTNFRMRPVAGLLSSRDFLNGLAFRVFFSTQYIRHFSQPLYTPEPDICHELLGHAPMFLDQDFADFSQEIGLASLGASDEDVQKLAHCYWHSVEFGLCQEDGKNKAYGAGLLSSFGELQYACDPEHPGSKNPPEIKDWDPKIAATQEFPITTYQPVYFLANSLGDAKHMMREYCEGLQRPFFALYNARNSTVHIDRPVRRTKGTPTHKICD